MQQQMNASFLIADDIMDASSTRRGKPCWYKVPQVGMVAINDATLLLTCIFRVIKMVFKDDTHPIVYLRLQDLFQEGAFRTSAGQLMDTTVPLNFSSLRLQDGVVGGKGPTTAADLMSVYNLEGYMATAAHKTAWFSFYLPLAAAMVLAGGGTCGGRFSGPLDVAEVAFSMAERIMVEMGQLYQVQNDFLDCYGDPLVTGKVGSDIEEGTSSWIICTALEAASAVQRGVILVRR